MFVFHSKAYKGGDKEVITVFIKISSDKYDSVEPALVKVEVKEKPRCEISLLDEDAIRFKGALDYNETEHSDKLAIEYLNITVHLGECPVQFKITTKDNDDPPKLVTYDADSGYVVFHGDMYFEDVSS